MQKARRGKRHGEQEGNRQGYRQGNAGETKEGRKKTLEIGRVRQEAKRKPYGY